MKRIERERAKKKISFTYSADSQEVVQCAKQLYHFIVGFLRYVNIFLFLVQTYICLSVKCIILQINNKKMARVYSYEIAMCVGVNEKEAIK